MDFVFVFIMFIAGMVLGYNLLCLIDNAKFDQFTSSEMTPEYFSQIKKEMPKRKIQETTLNLEKVTLLLADLKQKYDMIAQADTHVKAQVEVKLLQETIKNLEEKNRELNQKLHENA